GTGGRDRGPGTGYRVLGTGYWVLGTGDRGPGTGDRGPVDGGRGWGLGVRSGVPAASSNRHGSQRSEGMAAAAPERQPAIPAWGNAPGLGCRSFGSARASGPAS